MTPTELLTALDRAATAADQRARELRESAGRLRDELARAAALLGAEATPPEPATAPSAGDKPVRGATAARRSNGAQAQPQKVDRRYARIYPAGLSASEKHLARLRRERPDLAAEVERGERSLRSARVLCGWVKEPSAKAKTVEPVEPVEPAGGPLQIAQPLEPAAEVEPVEPVADALEPGTDDQAQRPGLEAAPIGSQAVEAAEPEPKPAPVEPSAKPAPRSRVWSPSDIRPPEPKPEPEPPVHPASLPRPVRDPERMREVDVIAAEAQAAAAAAARRRELLRQSEPPPRLSSGASIRALMTSYDDRAVATAGTTP
jgi:hypothetical protein